MPKPKKAPPAKNWMTYLAFSTELVAILGIWGVVGYFLDKYGGTGPWGFLGGLLIGVGHVLWRIMRM
jgi:F0F1-type ATP synthase assembly protein I